MLGAFVARRATRLVDILSTENPLVDPELLPKHLNLRDFLATGDFFDLTGRSNRDDVAATLGEPDEIGLITRKYRHPRIWVYGGIELTFGPFAKSALELIHFDHPNLPPPGSDSLTIDSWVIAENAPFDEIRNACRDDGIELTRRDLGSISQWLTSGGVTLTFSDDPGDSGLAAVSLVLRDSEL